MLIRIDDITKGAFELPTPIDSRDSRLKISIKSIGYCVGFYSINEDQTCRLSKDGTDSKFKIKPGLYTLKEMSRLLQKRVEGSNLTLNRITGLIDLTIPDNTQLWLTEHVRNMPGLNENNWLQSENIGNQPVEFLPAGGIAIYLYELSTIDLSSASRSKQPSPGPPPKPPDDQPLQPEAKIAATQTSETLVNSNLLSRIPILSGNFGQYISIQYENPVFLDLTTGEINLQQVKNQFYNVGIYLAMFDVLR